MTMRTLRQGNKETTVKIEKETAKALLVKGNCSEAWIPKKAIDDNGNIADWFLPKMELSHVFLFSAPYTENVLNHR